MISQLSAGAKTCDCNNCITIIIIFIGLSLLQCTNKIDGQGKTKQMAQWVHINKMTVIASPASQ